MSAARLQGIVSAMSGRRKILIVGGGVAALEATLALHELAPELVEIELVAPEPRFWYRPLAVAQPFGLGESRSFDLADLADDAGALLTVDSVVAIDAQRHVAFTERGATLPYESLLLACGAVPEATVPGALTFRGPADIPALADVVARVDAGEIERIVIAIPPGAAWSLPAYELALMFASHAEASGRGDDVRVALVTPEDEPLLLFGETARDAVRALLDDHRIALHTGYFVTEHRDGELHLLPAREIEADCVIALPALRGPQIDGVPQTRDGFVVVDPHGRVEGLPDVYAAGDVTRFPVKQGGLATQQADAAAAAIAADAGVLDNPEPFRPILRGLLLTGSSPRYLRRDVGAGGPGTVGIDPLWWPPSKLVGKHLAPFLANLAELRTDEPEGLRVEVEIPTAPGPRREVSDERHDTVRDLVTPWPLVVAPEDTLGEVAERMHEADLGSALVADFGRLVGILTSRDLVRAFAGRVHSSESRVREWMTAEPLSATPDTPLPEALRLMQEHEIHHLPIVEDDSIVGMVGMRAISRALATRAPVGLGF